MLARYFRQLIVILLLAVSILPAVTPATTGRAEALSGSEFKAGRIMDDGVFFNPNNFTFADVQAFIRAKVPTCDTNGDQMYGSSGMTRRAYAATKGYAPPF